MRSIRLGLARHRRASRDELAVDAPDSKHVQGRERRQSPRYLLSKSIYVIPILPGGRPDAARMLEGTTGDISEGGLAFEIAPQDGSLAKRLVIGLETDESVPNFATVEVRSFAERGGSVRIGCEFAADKHDLLRTQNLMPCLDPTNLRLRPRLPAVVLHAWEQISVLQRVLVNRAFLCPECGSLPSFRTGCRSCGAARVTSSRLIHHFACAHVDHIAAYEGPGAIVCPKCRTRGMIVGTDFEYLNGPYRCLECDWTDTSLENVGECLHCHLRFPLHKAREEDLIGYHVHRLDPLALINSS